MEPKNFQVGKMMIIFLFKAGDFSGSSRSFLKGVLNSTSSLPPKTNSYSGRSGARPSDHRPEDAEATLSSGELRQGEN